MLLVSREVSQLGAGLGLFNGNDTPHLKIGGCRTGLRRPISNATVPSGRGSGR